MATYTEIYSLMQDGALLSRTAVATTLAAGATGWFILDCLGFDQVRLTASAAANNAAVTVRAGAE